MPIINPKTGIKGITLDELVAATDKCAELWEPYRYSKNMSLDEKRAWVQDCLDELERYGLIAKESID